MKFQRLTPEQSTAAFWAKVEKTEACWLWRGNRGLNGYGIVKRNRKVGYAHRFAWRLTRGEIPPGLCVLHRCDVPLCVNPDHLFLGTQADNTRDMDSKGRRVSRWLFGEEHTVTKLTTAQVLEIRDRQKRGATMKELANQFSVCTSNIHAITSRKTWKHLP